MDQDELEHLVLAGDVASILDAFDASGSVRHRRWLLDGVGHALDRADPGSLSQGLVAKLRELDLAPGQVEAALEPPPDHAVLIPLVPGQGRAAIARLMCVTYDRSGTIGVAGLDPDAQRAVRDALRAAGQRRSYYDHHNLFLAPVRMRSLEGTIICGSSLGAGTFVSATALMERRKVHPGTAITGAVVDRRLLPVGSMDEKVRALVGRTDITRLIVPAADYAHARLIATQLGLEREIIGVDTVDALIDASLSKRPLVRADIDSEVATVRHDWDRSWHDFRWPSMRERLSRLIPDIPKSRPDLEVRVLTMLAACHRHLGTPEAPLDLLGEARAILATPEGESGVPDYDCSFVYRHVAMAEKDVGNFEAAERAAIKAEEYARSAKQPGARISALGTAGLIALARRDNDSAIRHISRALDAGRDFDMNRVPRTYGYLVLAHGRAGDLAAARAAFADALALLQELGASARARTSEQWVRTYMAEAAVLCHAPAEAIEALNAECITEAMGALPLPGLLARRWLGVAEIESGSVARGLSRLAASPGQHPHVRSSADKIAFIAHLAVLYEARARVARALLDDDARGRAQLALEHIPLSISGPAGPLAPHIASVREQLKTSAHKTARLQESLTLLLEGCVPFE